jgi:hypothetical protein
MDEGLGRAALRADGRRRERMAGVGSRPALFRPRAAAWIRGKMMFSRSLV